MGRETKMPRYEQMKTVCMFKQIIGGSGKLVREMLHDFLMMDFRRMTDMHLGTISKDLTSYLRRNGRFSEDAAADRMWRKFHAFMTNRRVIELVDGTTLYVFVFEGKYFPCGYYLDEPSADKYIIEDFITNKRVIQ